MKLLVRTGERQNQGFHYGPSGELTAFTIKPCRWTTFHFINDGPERALELARESAGSRDIRIAGGADVIQQYLNLGVVDELEIALAPVLFGGGRRLFENLREPGPQFRIDKVLDSPAATHLRYVRQ